MAYPVARRHWPYPVLGGASWTSHIRIPHRIRIRHAYATCLLATLPYRYQGEFVASKIRLLTRTFDLSVEGESVSEVEQLLDMVEKRGLVLARANPARNEAIGRSAVNHTTQNQAFEPLFE